MDPSIHNFTKPHLIHVLFPEITDKVVSSHIVIVLCAIAAGVSYLLSEILPRRRLVDLQGNTIPTGPWGFPVIGAFPFLTHFPELTLDYWAKKFGGLYSIWLGNQLFMIISDPVVAKDLLITNGAIFSSRKEYFIKSGMIFKGRGVTTTPYGEKWRKHRRIAWAHLHQRAVESYTPVLDTEAMTMIKSMYEASKAGPVDPEHHAGRYALNNMLTVTFGTRTDCLDHPMVMHALKISREFMNLTGPVANLVDFIPLLQRIPSPKSSRGRRLHNDILETYGPMVKDIETRLKDGMPVVDCAVKGMLETREKEGLDDLDIIILASAFMIGGVETTAGIIQWFLALIPAYPEIQSRAQEELDRVVGRDRFPAVEDEKDLPYCRAIIKEIGRVHNPFWLGSPHVNTEDFTYKGQFIPKDTVLLMNAWTIHHNEQRYPEPDIFNPDRYLGDSLSSSESAILPDPNARDHWMFGVGRRLCAGKLVAEREIWLTISRMLWAFEMHEIPDEPINLEEYDGESGRSPVPFRIRLIPRHEKIAELLEHVNM